MWLLYFVSPAEDTAEEETLNTIIDSHFDFAWLAYAMAALVALVIVIVIIIASRRLAGKRHITNLPPPPAVNGKPCSLAILQYALIYAQAVPGSVELLDLRQAVQSLTLD